MLDLPSYVFIHFPPHVFHSPRLIPPVAFTWFIHFLKFPFPSFLDFQTSVGGVWRASLHQKNSEPHSVDKDIVGHGWATRDESTGITSTSHHNYYHNVQSIAISLVRHSLGRIFKQWTIPWKQKRQHAWSSGQQAPSLQRFRQRSMP